MPVNQYTAQQALELLMQKLAARDETLAALVQSAIDVGKDVEVIEPSPDGRKKERVYRKTVPFTHEEALQVALDALQAYFVEQPLFVDAAADRIAEAVVGVPEHDYLSWGSSPAGEKGEPEPLSFEGKGQEKAVEIEVQTETQISKSGEETLPLMRVSKEQIEEQHRNIVALRKLADFKEE